MSDLNIPGNIDISLRQERGRPFLIGDCEKCGPGTEIHCRYHYAGWGGHVPRWCKDREGHLSKECQRCFYGWTEAK